MARGRRAADTAVQVRAGACGVRGTADSTTRGAESKLLLLVLALGGGGVVDVGGVVVESLALYLGL